jgi:hypothetical protein
LSSTSRRHGYRLFLRPAYLCAQVKLGSREERQAIKRRLEKRKLFRYSVNSLAKKGAVLLVHVDQWEAIEPVLNSFARAHVARFLVARIISNLAQARRRAFLAELGRRLSASGWLVLSKLMVNDHPVAWNYGFRFHGNWFWYQPTFDTDLEESSPGYCLLSKIISEACDHSEIEMVDLGLGAEGYKDRFANAVRPTLHGTLSLSPGQQVRAVGRYRLAQAVKVFPPAESAVRSLVERMIAVRSRFRQSGVSGTTKRMWARLSSIIAGQEEVVFYEWPDDTALTSRKSDGTRLALKAVSLEILADAVMRFENDAEARAYLLRSAQRLRERQAEGFVLFDGQSPVHFCWVTSFAGFWMDELRVRLEAPEPAAAMIFDCWTPPAVRGLGYYGMAVQSVARRLAVQKRHAWIFSSAKNRSSMTALGATVFQRRYTMVRHTTLMFHRFEKLNHQFVPEAPVGSRS